MHAHFFVFWGDMKKLAKIQNNCNAEMSVILFLCIVLSTSFSADVEKKKL